MGSRRSHVALRRRAGIALAVWAVALSLLAVASALPEGPVAKLTVDDAHPAIGQTVHFNASASEEHDAGNGRIEAYRFDFGDGDGTGWQTSPLASHAYAAAGTITASVTVVDARGQQGRATAQVQPAAAPPSSLSPDLVPIQAHPDPAVPRENQSVNLTVILLNRGAGTAESATVTATDVRPNGSAEAIGTALHMQPVAPSQTVSIVLGPFVAVGAGNHTLRIVVANVTPAETSSGSHELDVLMVVLPSASPPNRGPGGPGPGVSPLALALAAAAAASFGGAVLFLMRPRPVGPLEPPPATPADRSPPPIWPP